MEWGVKYHSKRFLQLWPVINTNSSLTKYWQDWQLKKFPSRPGIKLRGEGDVSLFCFQIKQTFLGDCTFWYHLKILINWPWKDCHHPQQNLNSIEGNDFETTRILAKFQEECKNVFLAWKSISFHTYLDTVERTPKESYLPCLFRTWMITTFYSS